MTRTTRILWILALAGFLSVGYAMAETGGDANFFIGQRSGSDDTLELADVDSPLQYGAQVSLDFQWPVMLAMDLFVSSDDSIVSIPSTFTLRFDTDVDTLELDLGVRKFWGEGVVHPYIGGGLAWVQLEALQIQSGDFGVPGSEYRDVVVDDQDSGVGFWACGGVLFRPRDGLNLGLDIRYTDSDVSLATVGVVPDLDLDTGGFHYGAFIGYHW